MKKNSGWSHYMLPLPMLLLVSLGGMVVCARPTAAGADARPALEDTTPLFVFADSVEVTQLNASSAHTAEIAVSWPGHRGVVFRLAPDTALMPAFGV